MVGYRLSKTISEHGAVSRGICKIENGELQHVEEWTGIQGNPILGINSMGEESELSGDELVSMNVWAFPSEIFKFLEKSFIYFLDGLSDLEKNEFYLPYAVDQWISQGVVKVTIKEANCQWMGVTYKEDKPFVQRAISELVNEGIYSSPLNFTN
jgi:hypothetical protein